MQPFDLIARMLKYPSQLEMDLVVRGSSYGSGSGSESSYSSDSDSEEGFHPHHSYNYHEGGRSGSPPEPTRRGEFGLHAGTYTITVLHWINQ